MKTAREIKTNKAKNARTMTQTAIGLLAFIGWL